MDQKSQYLRFKKVNFMKLQTKCLPSTLASIFALLVIFTFASCSKAKSHQDTGATQDGNNHLRSGLVALDSGDEGTAETEFQKSLSSDPLNNRARTALASLYAKQAGISLRDWLDPLFAP